MTVPQPCRRRPKPLDAGPFAPEVGSFRLHLAAEGKAPKTVRTYTEAVAWFAAAHLIPCTSCTRWEEVSGHDVQRWLVHLLTLYSDAYASSQFRALQQFFRWLWAITLFPRGFDQVIPQVLAVFLFYLPLVFPVGTTRPGLLFGR